MTKEEIKEQEARRDELLAKLNDGKGWDSTKDGFYRDLTNVQRTLDENVPDTKEKVSAPEVKKEKQNG